MNRDFERLLMRYAIRKTSPAEEQTLIGEAMQDQDTFNALMDEEILRALLDDPAGRSMLVKATAPEPAWKRVLQPLFARPLVWGGAGALATAILVLTLITGSRDKVSLTAMNVVPAGAERSLAELATSRRIGNVTIELTTERQSYQKGDDLRLTIRCNEAAEIVVVMREEGKPARRLYPNQRHTSASTPAGSITVPPQGARFKIDTAAGRVNFIAAAFAEGSGVIAAIETGKALPEPLAIASADIEVK